MKGLLSACVAAIMAILDVIITQASGVKIYDVVLSPSELEQLASAKGQVRLASSELNTSIEWIRELIDKHNYYRKLHGVPPLGFSLDLCKTSQKWANYLAITKEWRHNFEFNKGNRVGENLALVEQASHTLNVKGSDAVVWWYNETVHYDFETGNSRYENKDTGHFTQVVWRNSKLIGAAMAVVRTDNPPNSRVLVVAHYYPTGNVNGDYLENVPRPTVNSTNPYKEIPKEGPLIRLKAKAKHISPRTTTSQSINDELIDNEIEPKAPNKSVPSAISPTYANIPALVTLLLLGFSSPLFESITQLT